MFLLVWILVLKRTDWDIRPAGSGIYEKGTFTGRDFIPGSYPSLCFIPPSLRSPATLVLHECVTCLGKRDQLAPAPKKDYQKNITIVQPWCSPESSSHLVKATWGFSCVFAPIVLILVSLCLLLFRDPLFHADVTDSFDQRSAKNVGWWPLHPIWMLSCFHPGSPSLNVLFSLVECTESNYSLVEIFVKLFWRWNCYELSCGNIHVAGVDGYDVGATVEDDRDFWVKEFIRWLYAASYRDHQLRYEIFFSVHSADSFFQKWNIVGDLRVIRSVCSCSRLQNNIFSLSVKYSHARTTI